MLRFWKSRDGLFVTGLLLWFVVYSLGAASTFQPADSAEFLTVAANAGVAHPPGYPLYVMLGWLATHGLPMSVPKALAVLAALITCGTLLGIYATILVLCRERWAALIGALLSGVSLHLWKHATHPEAFALLGFFAAWLCYFSCLAADEQAAILHRRRAWLAYALFAGLASAHHHTIALTFPMGVWLIWRLFLSNRTKVSGAAPLFAWGILLFFIGLLPYLQLFWWGGADAPFGSWGELLSWSDVWAHMRRAEFGTFQSGVYHADRPLWFHSSRYLLQAVSPKGSFPLGLALFWLLGMAVSLSSFPASQHSQKKESFVRFKSSQGASVALFASWLLAGVAFPCLLQMGTSKLDQYVAARFFLLPDVFLGIFMGLGVAWLLPRLSKTLQRAGLFFVFVWFLVGAFVQYPDASSKHRNWLEIYALDLLKELPKNALLIEASDEAICFGVNYLQEVRKLRRDVQFICVPMLGRRWYVRRMRKKWPSFRYHWRPKRISSLHVIAAGLQQKRSVHVTTLYNRSIQKVFHWVPYGLSWRAMFPKERPPHPRLVVRRLHRVYQHLRSQNPLPSPIDAPWEANVLRRYIYPWMAVAHIFKQMKQPKEAQKCLEEAKKWQLHK